MKAAARGRPRRRRPSSPGRTQWKLPSPACPTIGATSRLRSMSRLVSVTHSASREIGTQTSVTMACAPGRNDLFAQKTWCRARHRRVRSSGLVAHSNGPPANSLRDLAEALRLLRDAGLGAVEFEEQHWRFGQAELRVGIAGANLHLVEELDAGDRNAGLDRRDRGVAGGLDRRERADAGGDRLGDAVQLQASVR